MSISNYAREVVAALIAGSLTNRNLGSGYIGIGSASGTVTVNTTGLIFQTDRNQFTGGSTDLATPQVITMTGDFSSVELSGTPFRQFGVFVESSGGKAWQVENASLISFNGTQELSIVITWQVY